MKKFISGSFIAALVLISTAAQATLVEISANSAVTPGVKVFVPNGTASFPTPFYDVSNAPVPQSTFMVSDTIRAATQLDLTQIVLGTDENDPSSDLQGGFYGDGYLDWTYTFEALFNPNLSFTGHVGYGWVDVSNAQNNGLTQVNFVSLETYYSGLFSAGQWKVSSYVEGNLMSEANFSIPEPGSLALLGMGLFMVGRRKLKN